MNLHRVIGGARLRILGEEVGMCSHMLLSTDGFKYAFESGGVNVNDNILIHKFCHSQFK